MPRLRALAPSLPSRFRPGPGLEGESMTIFERIDADLIEPQRLAGSVIDQLRTERRRPAANGSRGITAREALRALSFEAQLVAVAAENLAHGMALADGDRARLLVAWGRITEIASEAGA